MRPSGGRVVFFEVQSSNARAWQLGIAQLVAWGALYYPPAVLERHLCPALGIERTELFAWLGLSLLVSAVLGGGVGRALRRWGGRSVLCAGTAIGALGLLVLSVASSRAGLAVAVVLVGVATSASLYDALFAAEADRVDHRRLVSIVSVVGGFASTLSWPLTHVLAETFGWRMALRALAGLLLVLAVPAYLVAATAIPPAARAQHERGAWRPALALAAGVLVSAALSAHLVAWLAGRLGSRDGAVVLAAIVGPAQVAGRALDGLARSRMPALALGRIALFVVGASTALLAVVEHPIALGLGIAVFGVGSGLLTVARGAAVAELGGPRVLGAFVLTGQLARALAPVSLAAWDPRNALALSSVLAVVGALALTRSSDVGGPCPAKEV